MKKSPSVIFDFGRQARIGLPESVFCDGKSVPILNSLIKKLHKKKKPIFFTRLKHTVFKKLNPEMADLLSYHPLSNSAFLNGTHKKKKKKGSVAIVTAGTSDLDVAEEAAQTLKFLGIQYSLIADIGVAGLWRLKKNLKKINRHSVIIAIAGMDAALASVLGGLTNKPLIGVPTSRGYGMTLKGKTALQSMLVSCAPGVAVMNINNGYGAACAAVRILNLI